ncbi:SDR family oxidoreductase [Mesosutterella sp. OilRF-GAM-744-9]|uniref:Enoyl-[acyl-carrier-protein] reductase [NADH] n=1 Tax=Mesosutterella porci TaxID=2915351 RepID=A0ABS9MSR7_9BURK|nr:SDR family oxidoreductase [Mesosutterella sp. oilRF-744-WT-GAM-9]MCG5031649.1 SDR family oxidoreductase [Mesosutterella sp. oilRF-744-WT-GAM-9]MCI6530686.1 SDR family oxidoreductase [Mesosutterella sp.]
MGFLNGKKFLITGVLSNRSIAYGIAKACRREGAELAFSYAGEHARERIGKFAEEFGSDVIFPLDVTQDDQIAAAVSLLKERWGGLDGFVHSIGYAPREAISGDFLEGLSRSAFATAMDISAYSFPALAKAFLPLMKGRQASVLTLTYLGSERAVPNYNTMGLAKAALEASTRYLALSLGADGIRANAISSGPIKTLAAAGIKDFGKMLHQTEQASPLKKNVTTDEVGNAAAFLLSDLASGITGDIVYVDAGYHIAAGVDAGQ